MELDTSTNKIVVVNFPGYCGGKFLINCVGLSDDAFFQHHWWVDEQLKGRFSSADKLNYLLTQIAQTTDIWSDLGLGCVQLFGDMSITNEYKVIRWNEVLDRVIASDKYFFIVAHDQQHHNYLNKVWPNAKNIKLTNCHQFVSMARPKNLDIQGEINIDNKLVLLWNSIWMLDEDIVVEQVRQIYNWLGLTDFNDEYIRLFYNAWYKKITEIGRNGI